jgi:hypothetical protein
VAVLRFGARTVADLFGSSRGSDVPAARDCEEVREISTSSIRCALAISRASRTSGATAFPRRKSSGVQLLIILMTPKTAATTSTAITTPTQIPALKMPSTARHPAAKVSDASSIAVNVVRGSANRTGPALKNSAVRFGNLNATSDR